MGKHLPGYHKHSAKKHHVYDNQNHIKKTMRKQIERRRIADRLRETRQKCGLSQSQASVAWGISKRTLQGWEQGKEPRGLYLQAIERILEKSEGAI